MASESDQGRRGGSTDPLAWLSSCLWSTSDVETQAAFYVDAFGASAHSLGDRALVTFDPCLTDEGHEIAARGDFWRCARLELIEAKSPTLEAKSSGSVGGVAGFWKIGVTSPDVDGLRGSLLQHGVEVSQARQFGDIGYLCHFADPLGLQVELLQHHFAPPLNPDAEGRESDSPETPRGPVLGQVTVRVRDRSESLDFYRQVLGFRHLSHQPVVEHGFELDFLAGTSQSPPEANLTAVGNREWLWQRPYTTLELVFNEESPTEGYDVGLRGTGFAGIGVTTSSLERFVESLDESGVSWQEGATVEGSRVIELRDPDGYRIRVSEPVV